MATITSRPVMAIPEITGSANLQDDNGTLLVACFGERAHNVAAPHGPDCTVLLDQSRGSVSGRSDLRILSPHRAAANQRVDNEPSRDVVQNNSHGVNPAHCLGSCDDRP
jgi:hypothetical protein